MRSSFRDNAASGDFSAGKNISCWFEPGLETALFPELTGDMQTDVVIVGAGLAGLTTAYCVASRGKKVIVIDDGAVGSGETGRTTAQIVTALDNRYFLMENIFGIETTAIIAESHKEAINFIEATIKKENIDCDFERVDGYLFLHNTDTEDSLLKEFESLQRCNIPSRLLDHTPGISSEKGSIHYSGQAQLQPIKYLLGLCRAIEKMGGKIFINTHADHIDHTGIVSDKGYIINAGHIVVATNAPVNNKFATMLKQWAYRSYVITATIPKGILPKALWWDTGDHHNETSTPYHYVRLEKYDESNDLLICGGEDHVVGLKKGISEAERYARLEHWTRERFPIRDVIHKWSGEVLVPMDSIAFIGKNVFDRENVYIITGEAGIGVTYCTIGGILINDLIHGIPNKWEEIYKPSRFIPKASASFFRMLKGDLVAVLKKWFYSENTELSAIKADDAKVVILDGKKCGAYRDSSGKLFLVSAECTHLKCMVSWNADEKSWDCPCHGSRFTYTGKVINGPANKDLPSFNEENN